MREGVHHNNEACALIAQGDNDAAITVLNQALLLCSAAATAEGMATQKPNPTFSSSTSGGGASIGTVNTLTYNPHHQPHRQVPHTTPTTRRRNDIANQPAHYYPENDYDEGMRTFSQPLFLCDPSVTDACGSTTATIFFNLGIAYSRKPAGTGEDGGSTYSSEEEALVCFEKSFRLQLATSRMHSTCTFPSPGTCASSSIHTDTRAYHEIMHGPALHVILHNIGHSHFRSKRYDDSITSYTRALDFLMEDSPEIAAAVATNPNPNATVNLHRLEISATLNCIAVSKFYAGHDDTDNMLTIFEKALALRLATNNSTTPATSTDLNSAVCAFDRETATIINNTGRVRYLRGEFETALSVYKKACGRRLTILGQSHIDVAACTVNMAQSLEYVGYNLEAIDFYKQFLHIALPIRGEYAEDVCRALLRVGQLSYIRGDLDEAHAFFVKGLHSAKGLFGPNHDTVANIYNKIGNVLFEKDMYDDALSAYRSGLHLERALYPHYHEQIAVTLLNIGRIYHGKCDLEQALQLYKDALDIRRHLNSDETVSTILFNIGLIYEAQNKLEEAVTVLEQAIVLHKKLKEEKSLVASTLNALGHVHHKRGSLHLALASFLEAIDICNSSKECVNSGDTGTSTSTSSSSSSSSTKTPCDIMNLYFNAATVCKIMGETDKALHFYKESLQLAEQQVQDVLMSDDDNGNGNGARQHRSHGPNTEQIAVICCEMGLILKNRRDLHNALSHLKQSSQLCLRLDLENGNARTLNLNRYRGLAHRVFTTLGDLYLEMGDSENAMESYAFVIGMEGAAEITMGDFDSNNLGSSRVGDFFHALLCKTNPPAAAAA